MAETKISTFRPDAQVIAAMAALGGDGDAPTTASWQSLREQNESMYPVVTLGVPVHPEVRTEVFTARKADGVSLDLHWFTSDAVSGAAVVHAHGGGRVAGRVGLFAPYLADYVARSGVSILSVEYRLAPEVTGVVPTEDVYAGLTWLVENAGRLGVDPARIAVMGESAGGGLAAGAALLARRDGVSLAGQVLIYPMLDDRTTTADAYLAPHTEWLVSANQAGWNALLGDERGTDAVSDVVAPARTNDFSGLPRAYLEVGELDLFRTETIAYASGLWSAGISTELHVLPGAMHGFDHWAPDADLTRRAMTGRITFLRTL